MIVLNDKGAANNFLSTFSQSQLTVLTNLHNLGAILKTIYYPLTVNAALFSSLNYLGNLPFGNSNIRFFEHAFYNSITSIT